MWASGRLSSLVSTLPQVATQLPCGSPFSPITFTVFILLCRFFLSPFDFGSGCDVVSGFGGIQGGLDVGGVNLGGGLIHVAC